MSAWVDLTLVFLTFFFSIVWNVEVGIVVSLIISLLLVVHRSSKTRMTILGRIPGTDKWKAINENPDAEEEVPGVLIVRIRDNLDFGNYFFFCFEVVGLTWQIANTAQLKGN
jgi:MFS superfamily sulfate permease-like transporter